MNEVVEFIKRRFPIDCNWTSGNCYFFAVILKARFPDGKVVYDDVEGHFLFSYQGRLYDYNGEQPVGNRSLIEWNLFDEYDHALKQRIIRDCIM